MLRATLLRLSHEHRLRGLTTSFGPARRLARRFVAGETPEQAMATVRALNQKGILTSLDYLGENVTREEEVWRANKEYLDLLEEIDHAHLHSTISVKLTQLGLDLREELAYRYLRMVAETASRFVNVVEIDMEGSAYTERTITLYRNSRRDFSNLLVCIQASLYRSESDIRSLLPVGPRIRLCKGAYQEPPNIAFPQKKDVDENYRRLLSILWSEEARDSGTYVGIATHDQSIIEWAKSYTRDHGIPKDKFEFQMLHGIRRDLQESLTGEGYTVRVYVPYGQQWYPYLMRRMAERPANLLFILRNLFRA